MAKKWLLLACVSLLFNGCSPTFTPLKGKYLEEPYIIYSKKSLDQIWSNAIDILAIKGFPIKILDKENGLIVCERVSLMSNYTYEYRSVVKSPPNEYVVLPSLMRAGIIYDFPKTLTGVVTIRIRNEGDSVLINVNLTALDITTDPEIKQSSLIRKSMRSTGEFEENFANMIK